MFKQFLLVTALIIAPLTISAQSDDGKVNNSFVKEVRKGIYMIQGKGGNIAFSTGNSGVFMIDSQFAESTKDNIENIERFSKKPIHFLINTHHHGDHTGGNINFAENGTTIVSQDNVRKRLEAYRKSNRDKKLSNKLLPMITFSEDMTFHYNGEQIFIFHVHEAHTDGDAMVYFTKSNVLHTGDVLFKGRYPYIDLNNGGSLEGYISALERLSGMIDQETLIIPGHGDIAKYSDVRQTIGMLKSLKSKVAIEYLKLKTEDQVAAMTDLTEVFDNLGFGSGFITSERMLRTVYKEIDRTMADRRGNVDMRMGDDDDDDSQIGNKAKSGKEKVVETAAQKAARAQKLKEKREKARLKEIENEKLKKKEKGNGGV